MKRAITKRTFTVINKISLKSRSNLHNDNIKTLRGKVTVSKALAKFRANEHIVCQSSKVFNVVPFISIINQGSTKFMFWARNVFEIFFGKAGRPADLNRPTKPYFCYYLTFGERRSSSRDFENLKTDNNSQRKSKKNSV